MRTIRVAVPADGRAPGTPASLEARHLVFQLQARGLVVTLEGRHVRVRPGDQVTAEEREALRACFHEVRELLAQEQRVS